MDAGRDYERTLSKTRGVLQGTKLVHNAGGSILK
jgi:hypothetical protein